MSRNAVFLLTEGFFLKRVLQFVLSIQNMWFVYSCNNHNLFWPSQAEHRGRLNIYIKRLTPKDKITSGLRDSHGCHVYHPKWNFPKSRSNRLWMDIISMCRIIATELHRNNKLVKYFCMILQFRQREDVISETSSQQHEYFCCSILLMLQD